MEFDMPTKVWLSVIAIGAVSLALLWLGTRSKK